MSNRILNFSPGPAVLPEEVLEICRESIWSYASTGIGIMEMSHRSKEFEPIVAEAEANFRQLLSIPDDYAFIFAHGGATMQFSMVPMNLLSPGTQGNYLLTGFWADKAFNEAKRFGEAHAVCNSKAENYRLIPKEHIFSKNPAYVHFTSNNTIVGTQFRTEPKIPDGVPLIVDTSSDILSRPLDVSKYGIIYACAQKNLGPAGVAIAIIRRDLLSRTPKNLPILLDYNTHVDNGSMYNTPSCLPIYVVGEVLKWVKRQGGVAEMEKRSKDKAKLLYDEIDSNPFYEGHAAKEDRSLMNVAFRLKKSDLEGKFLKEAEAAGLSGLKGHKLLGGFRASIYNAFPRKGVETLVGFMKEFAKKNG